MYVMNDFVVQVVLSMHTICKWIFVLRAKETVTFLLTVIKEAFDNEVTPYFALVMCLWGEQGKLLLIYYFIKYSHCSHFYCIQSDSLGDVP